MALYKPLSLPDSQSSSPKPLLKLPGTPHTPPAFLLSSEINGQMKPRKSLSKQKSNEKRPSLARSKSVSASNSNHSSNFEKSISLMATDSVSLSYPIANLEKIIRDPVSLKRLMQYCDSQHSEENVIFLKAVQKFRALGSKLVASGKNDTKVKELATNIFDTHLKNNCEYEVCLSFQRAQLVNENYKNGEYAECFRLAEVEAMLALKNDIYPRFIKSPLYNRLAEELLLALFCNYTNSNDGTKKPVILGDPVSPSSFALNLQQASFNSGWFEKMPNVFVFFENPLGHELIKQFIYKFIPKHLHTVILLDAIALMEEIADTTMDSRWIILCKNFYLDNFVNVESLLNDSSYLAPKTRRGPNSANFSATSTVTPVDASQLTGRSADLLNSARSLVEELSNNLKFEDISTRPVVPEEMRSKLYAACFSNNCDKQIFQECNKYLKKSLELLYVRFLESEMYHHVQSDYDQIRTRELNRRVQGNLAQSINSQKYASTNSPDMNSNKENNKEERKPLLPAYVVSLEEILYDFKFLEIFVKFCKSEHSEENIEAWKAVEEYSKSELTDEKLLALAKTLFNRFFKTGAQDEVPLDSRTKEIMQKKIDAKIVDCTIFDQAHHKILEFLRQDAYVRFLKSPLYDSVVFIIEQRSLEESHMSSCGICF